MRLDRVSRWVIAVPMALLALATIYPILFTANVAFKDRREYVLDRFAVAESFGWDNFVTAWTRSGLDRYFLNSVGVTVASVALLLVIGSMAGFAFSHLTFRGSRILFAGVLGTLLIPFQVIMVPFFRLFADTGLLDTYAGLVLAYVSQFLPFTIFLMTSYYAGVPRDVVEAARIDGNSLFGVYRRIMLPLGRPALLSVGILNALYCWNDVLVALLIMQSQDHRTLMVGITALRGQYSSDIPTFAAGVLIAAVPMLAIYLVFQRQITDGVTAGSTKG